jgi:hypothetical protein
VYTATPSKPCTAQIFAKTTRVIKVFIAAHPVCTRLSRICHCRGMSRCRVQRQLPPSKVHSNPTFSLVNVLHRIRGINAAQAEESLAGRCYPIYLQNKDRVFSTAKLSGAASRLITLRHSRAVEKGKVSAASFPVFLPNKWSSIGGRPFIAITSDCFPP